MPPSNILTLADEAMLALSNVADFAADVVNPTLRIGVTGLSRAGKTVFITALVQALTGQTNLPLVRARAEGRISKVVLRPQPDMALARFQIEEHLDALTGAKRTWPQSTKQISELRLVIHYETTARLTRALSRGTLTLDIVDYPGEWLLDLGLLEKDFETWSNETLKLAQDVTRAPLSKSWLQMTKDSDPSGSDDEEAAKSLADSFKAYLIACRDARVSLSTLPPGRFLMPGDLDGSPALTFAPLPKPPQEPSPGSLYSLMKSRYDAYKELVVKPFFLDHFAKLDRQIVLVDALSALNAGPNAVRDLQRALTDILSAFRTGRKSLFSNIVSRKVSRVLFAATKADHIHHIHHDHLEKLLSLMVKDAMQRADFTGAEIDVAALASIRATREASVARNRKDHPVIVGIPEKGEVLAGKTFDGRTETAFFPGDLPENLGSLLEQGGTPYSGLETAQDERDADLRFLKFRPPSLPDRKIEPDFAIPHIRLDKAIEFLIGDRLI